MAGMERVSALISQIRAKSILTIIVGLMVSGLLIFILDRVFLFFYSKSYVDELSTGLGLHRNAATILTWAVFAFSAVALSFTLSFSKSRRRIGLAGLFALMIAQPAVLLYFDKSFDTFGNAQKCYIVTRDSILYGNTVGRDPNSGLECKPLTPEIAERVEEYRKGSRPRKYSYQDKPTFFSERTGQPVVWYSLDKNGDAEAFDLMGFNPDTGEELKPITRDVAARWNEQSKPPVRVYPDDDFIFFDPVTGRPTAFFYRNGSDFEFYNKTGFHPRTGERYQAVDAAVITEWKKSLAARCYILTRESVIYKTNLGLDPATGKQCRPITAEILLRLREYEKGNRPKKIDVPDPVFFDVRSGEPNLWYAKSKSGRVELYSLMGFHPETGEELAAMTRDVADEWKRQRETSVSRPPKRVDPTKDVFFDPKTGEARAWFWKGPDGQYEFYDGPGFHPRTGEKLEVLTKEYVEKQDREEKKRKDEQSKREQDERLAEERRRRELEAQSAAQRTCDELAANPNDTNRVGEGMPYDQMKFRAKEALEACEQAVKQNASEKRFQYQLARLLQLSDRPRAGSIFQKLVAAKYPAAFDNYGWIAYTDRKNPGEATEWFRKGVELSDPDSMVSLAEMIDRGHAFPRGEWEQKINLYTKAADLGQKSAIKAVEVERSKVDANELNRARQIEQQQMAAQMFGMILQGMVRR